MNGLSLILFRNSDRAVILELHFHCRYIYWVLNVLKLYNTNENELSKTEEERVILMTLSEKSQNIRLLLAFKCFCKYI